MGSQLNLHGKTNKGIKKTDLKIHLHTLFTKIKLSKMIKFNTMQKHYKKLLILSVLSFVILAFCTDLSKLPPTAGPLLILSPSQNYGSFPLAVSFYVKAIPSRGKMKYLIIDYGDNTQKSILENLKDGETTLQHTYERFGIFEVKLYGMDESGSNEVKTSIITNDSPQIINFQAYKDEEFLEPTSSFSLGDTVYIKAICKDSNGIGKVIIDWGDNSYDEKEKDCSSSHIYKEAGDFTIKIYVSDDNKFAPYPLSSYAEVKIGIFISGSSPKNFPPIIDGFIEKIDNKLTQTNIVAGMSPLTVSVLIAVEDPEGDEIKELAVDWGNGKSDLISATGSKYFTRKSHTYETGGIFQITVSAKDSFGKKGMKKIATVSVAKQAPIISVESKAQDNQNPSGKTYTNSATIENYIITFDVSLYRVFVLIEGNLTDGGQEIFIKELYPSAISGLKANTYSFSVNYAGDYKVTFYAVSDIDLDIPSEIYCSSSISLCSTYKGKLENAKIKNSSSFSFKLVYQ